VIKTLKVTFSGHDDIKDLAKKLDQPTSARRSLEDR
jgi:hypothetical protein